MTDSFADLWSSSAPKEKPQTLASASSSITRSSKSDVFSLLASSAHQQQQSRYGTPSPAPSSSITSSRASNTDAFSDLFSSSTSTAVGGKGMTIAARMAMEAQARSSKSVGLGTEPKENNPEFHDTAWAGLDSLAGSGSGSTVLQPSKSAGAGTDDDDWGLGDFGSSTAASVTTTTTSPSVISQPQPQNVSLKSTTVWDFDEFASSSSSAQPSRPSSQPKHHHHPQQKSTKAAAFDSSGFENRNGRNRGATGLFDLDDEGDDFGFGKKEGLLGGKHDASGTVGGGSADEDDILGMLAQPVEVVKVQSQTRKVSPSPISRERSDHDRVIPSTRTFKVDTSSASPPPHVLGQIVEMGFGIEQATKALAMTKDGRDVQAAMEILLGGSGGPNTADIGSATSRRVTDDERETELPSRTRGPPKGFKERERERMERMRREREFEPENPSGGVDIVSEHADRLLSQASEIGMSVLSKASAFWKERKERVVKVYEEHATGSVAGQKERADGRPKWMKDAPGVGYMDEGDTKTLERLKQPARQESERHIERQDRYTEPEQDAILFSDEQLPPSSHPLHQRPPMQETLNRPPRVAHAKTVPPSVTRDRPLPTTSPSILSSVNNHRTVGTSQFKLGQYASAVDSYTAAINHLPRRHLLLLPLLNNRALARMKIGEYKGAADDAGRALETILIVDDRVSTSEGFDPNLNESMEQVTASSWHPSMEPSFLLMSARQKANDGGWTHHQGVGVDLVDGYVKALRRRGEANEGRERWSEALKDWEVLSAGDGSWVKEQVKKEAQRGAARCRKMMAIDTVAPGSAEEAPKPKPTVVNRNPTSIAPMAPSVALRSLQATNAQAEVDDNLKHQLKDTVDARLAAWRTGKETNIRALLASLDMVLWEDLLKGVKVGGLHELVTPAQVKKGYVKAIGKVHPDKLNADNTTVEHRMLANGVFGTLSEAWIAFQNSNGL